MNLMKELRESALFCSNVDYRDLLKRSADDIHVAIIGVFHEATAENMIALNGAWIHGVRVLSQVPPEATPNAPLSEAMREAA